MIGRQGHARAALRASVVATWPVNIADDGRVRTSRRQDMFECVDLSITGQVVKDTAGAVNHILILDEQ